MKKVKQKTRYKVVKTLLEKVINSKTFNINVIENKCSNITKLSAQMDMFARLYLLFLKENKKNIPIIDINFYKMVSLVLMKRNNENFNNVDSDSDTESNSDSDSEIVKTKGRQLCGKNLILYETLVSFYNDSYSKLGYDKIDSLHMGQIIAYLCEEKVTSLENLIKNNFVAHINGFVNSIFIEQYDHNKTNIENEKNNQSLDKIKEIERIHYNEILLIIKEILDRIYLYMKKNVHSKCNKNKKTNLKLVIKNMTNDERRIYVFLNKTKNKILPKYKSICKNLKINDNTEVKEYDDYNDIEVINNSMLLMTQKNNIFVNDSKILKTELRKNRESVEKNKDKKTIMNELQKVKKDLINNTKTADEKYAKWIDEMKKLIIPDYDSKIYTLHSFIHENPQDYINCMLNMLLILENNNKKLFQFSPLSGSNIPRNIMIDTKILIELFEDQKQEKLTNLNLFKQKIWKRLFEFDNKIFKQNGYKFSYKMMTDGVSVSLLFIHNDDSTDNDNIDDINVLIETYKKEKKYNLLSNDEIENIVWEDINKEKKNKKIKRDLKKIKQEKFKALPKKEQEKILNIEKEKKDKEKKDNASLLTKLKKEKDDKFKALSKEEQEKIKLENRRKYDEFLYIDDLTENELCDVQKKFNENKLAVIDPGKRSLLFLKGNNGKVYEYTNKEHMKRTKRLSNGAKLLNYREKKKVIENESELSKYNSKSVKFSIFSKFIEKKNEVNKEVNKVYEEKIFRKYRFYRYINTQRANMYIINKIKEIFGEEIVIFYGDWSIGKSMKNFISTPNLTLKRLLSKYFKLYNLDEYNTSKLNNITHTPCEHLSLPDKYGRLRELHSVLTFKMEKYDSDGNSNQKPRKVNINRDNNATNNMLYIVQYFLENKRFPDAFMRNQKEITQNDLLINLHLIFSALKNVKIEYSDIEELLKITKDSLSTKKREVKNIDQIVYIIKNAFTKKKAQMNDKIEKDEKIRLITNKILRELKSKKENIISSFINKTELKNLYEKQIKKSG